MTQTNWNQRFYDLADHIAQWSKHRKTKVGAVIFNPFTRAILSTGYNGIPANLDDTDDFYHTGPEKAKYWEHAERNAVYMAAQHGTPLAGMGIAVNWYPCADCARALVRSGICTLVGREPNWNDEKWGADFAATKAILDATSINVQFVDPPPLVTGILSRVHGVTIDSVR